MTDPDSFPWYMYARVSEDRFTIMVISHGNPKSEVCHTLIEWLKGFFIVHNALGNTAHSIPLNSSEHCICATPAMWQISDKYLWVSFEPQPNRMSYWGRCSCFSVYPFHHTGGGGYVETSFSVKWWGGYVEISFKVPPPPLYWNNLLYSPPPYRTI